MKQLSHEWFAARRGRITGSNVGAILGLSPHTTRDDVMRRMCMEWQGMESEFTGNVATEYGQFHEKLAVQDLQDNYDVVVKECGFIPHTELYWLGASPDGLIDDNLIVEIKCPYSLRDDESPVFRSINEQPHYFAQIQIEMFCAGRKSCIFYQWNRYDDKFEYVYFDHGYIDGILPELKQFYDEYLSMRELPIEPLLKDINTQQSKQLLDEYRQLTDAIDNATDRKKEILSELVILSKGENAQIWYSKLTKVQREGAISYAKVVKDHCPNVNLEPYKGKPSEYWILK
jgi:putative phage-type endonuclease